MMGGSDWWCASGLTPKFYIKSSQRPADSLRVAGWGVDRSIRGVRFKWMGAWSPGPGGFGRRDISGVWAG